MVIITGANLLPLERRPMWEIFAPVGIALVGSAKFWGHMSERKKVEEARLQSGLTFIIDNLKQDMNNLREEVVHLRISLKDSLEENKKLIIKHNSLEALNVQLLDREAVHLGTIAELRGRLAKVRTSKTQMATSMQRQIVNLQNEIDRVMLLYEQATGKPLPVPEPLTPEQEQIRMERLEAQIANKLEEEWLSEDGFPRT